MGLSVISDDGHFHGSSARALALVLRMPGDDFCDACFRTVDHYAVRIQRMRDFNWKPEWWIDGVSMFYLAHRFCRANTANLGQFRQFFTREDESVSKTAYPLHHSQTSFDLDRLTASLGVAPDRAPMLFPSHYFVAHAWGEVRNTLKYCPTCMQQGIHLSLQQISWIHECPVHREPLVLARHCGPTNYSLTEKSVDDVGLCRCGKIRFGEFESFSKSELDTLAKHYRAIKQLQCALPHGVDQYRVSTEQADRAEYQHQLSLATKVFRILLQDIPSNADMAKIRTEPVRFWRRDYTDSRLERFRQFCKYAMKCADDSDEDWTAALVGRLMEEEYFGDEGMTELRYAMERNGCTHGLRSEDVPILKEIFSIRLMECVARGARPIRRSLHPDLRLAMRMVGEPLCQIVWRKGENGCKINGTAYWLDDDEHWPDGKWPWVKTLATHVVRNWHDYARDKYRIEALERKLDLPEFIRLFDERDAQLTQSGCRQMRLFDWLE